MQFHMANLLKNQSLKLFIGASLTSFVGLTPIQNAIAVIQQEKNNNSQTVKTYKNDLEEYEALKISYQQAKDLYESSLSEYENAKNETETANERVLQEREALKIIKVGYENQKK